MTTETYSEKLRTAGYETDKVRARLENISGRVQDQLSTLLSVIGSDNFGSQYVKGNGSPGLTERLQGAVDGTSTMAESWANLSKGQYEAAVAADRNEEAARQAIEQV
ncbi:hypothetical protein ACFYT3_19745 [Nocardia amikacinitolerans]|uniref:Excreted virulence factor EspC, type VII ESX diderm n=1 Tax=Nocardia amikacinitolerans TaxID=756689 RepID=A0A285LSN4_9NOCA|nr:hypothetical protein [Nocardia amikacinitolerans]MCP2277029.1 hypothetical protein [Nocardia amikacinitolerans]MCP2289335.1 hypothetical protein [Nocardia amikacinitolerans]MCP2295631.1 hypothetical protein [Nocardia amikacinitolerans]MCP2317553.1 hypothetical protein [Nocardia amikacinitolerans]SNY87930.1 hypothetical protein SAMN04244553_4890 [Nocardia amikacinitolerans]